MPESYKRDEAIKALAHQTINEDSHTALRWAETISEPSFRHRSFRDTFDIWARGDVTAASEYINGMESSPERDYAITGFARSIAESHPSAAITWAKAIGDVRMRESSLTTVAQTYLATNPDAASAWLPDSGLPPTTVERLLREREAKLATSTSSIDAND